MDELMKACHCLHLEVADSIAFDVQDKARAVKTELDALRTQLKSVEADAAVMRRVLGNCRPKEEYDGAWDEIDEAVATNSGKSLLERLKEAEWLVEKAYNNVAADRWRERRDAFLNPKPQDVNSPHYNGMETQPSESHPNPPNQR